MVVFKDVLQLNDADAEGEAVGDPCAGGSSEETGFARLRSPRGTNRGGTNRAAPFGAPHPSRSPRGAVCSSNTLATGLRVSLGGSPFQDLVYLNRVNPSSLHSSLPTP